MINFAFFNSSFYENLHKNPKKAHQSFLSGQNNMLAQIISFLLIFTLAISANAQQSEEPKVPAPATTIENVTPTEQSAETKPKEICLYKSRTRWKSRLAF
jgi:hypothetical protein